MQSNKTKELAARFLTSYWIIFVVGFLLLMVIFRDGVLRLLERWNTPEYGHAYFIPLVSGYLIWQKRLQFLAIPPNFSMYGALLVLLGLIVFVLGELGTLHIIVQYGFLCALLGWAWTYFGWQGFRVILIPLLYLSFMIPLPNILYHGLSSELQLISSKIGVAFIRLFGISVHLEGNVIDLGLMKLQVVEACSGLKYLFPLASIGFACAYLFKGKLWKRVVIALATLPITVVMNSARIAITGILVEYFGRSMAEGFFHLFEGMVVFVGAIILLLIVMAIVARLGRDKTRLADAFVLEVEKGESPPAAFPSKPNRGQYAVIGFLAFALVGSFLLQHRTESVPERRLFSELPDHLDGWKGQRANLETLFVQKLKFHDYILSNYSDEKGGSVHLYSAYYQSQRKGISSHSPKSCLPADGWDIVRSDTHRLVLNQGGSLNYNRVLIKRGESTQIVYYWFKERDRVLTNEYLVKWYLVVDAIGKNRTDGALVRLTTLLHKGESEVQGDERMQRFARSIANIQMQYIPD